LFLNFNQITDIMPQTGKDEIDQEKIKINEVGKTFFEIQFDAKEKIITRLKMIYLVVSRILISVFCENSKYPYNVQQAE